MAFGLGAFIAAGAAQGLGTGLVEQARAKREEALKDLDRRFQAERDDKRYARDLELKKMDQGFTAGENALNRTQRNIENQSRIDAERDLEEMRAKNRAAEAEKDRATRGYEYGSGPNGETMAIRGTKAVPVTNDAGEPVRGIDRYKPNSPPSETEKRLRFTEGLNAGKPEYQGDAHDWSKSVRTWRALGIAPTDPRVVEFVQDDLKAQAGKKGLRGTQADAWVADQMNQIGIAPANDGRRSENLEAPGAKGPRMAAGGGTTTVERAEGPAPEDRIGRAFGAFPKADRGAPASQGESAGTDIAAKRAALIDKARDAISRGAPRDAVIQRLRSVGIDPAGL